MGCNGYAWRKMNTWVWLLDNADKIINFKEEAEA